MAELQDVQASETQYVNSLTVMLLVFKTYLDHRDTKAESVWLEKKKRKWCLGSKGVLYRNRVSGHHLPSPAYLTS